MNAIIKFKCPNCGLGMDGEADLEFAEVTCPTCNHVFFPKPINAAAPAPAKSSWLKNVQEAFLPDNPPTPQAPQVENPNKLTQPTPGELLAQRQVELRNVAGNFSACSMIAVFFAGFALLVCLTLVANGSVGDAVIAATIAGSLLAMSAMLYVIAQLVFIRANTER